jgi:hypothetical protein
MYLLSLIIILSYIAGSIPTGLLVGRWFGGTDIRQHGSGNIGSTNVMRTLGWKLGLLVQAGDILKGLLAVLVIARLHYGDFPFNNRTPFDDYHRRADHRRHRRGARAHLLRLPELQGRQGHQHRGGHARRHRADRHFHRADRVRARAASPPGMSPSGRSAPRRPSPRRCSSASTSSTTTSPATTP